MTTQSMNHQQALETHATERYLLGDMNAGDRHAFEEHYLECAECLEAVTFGAEFLEAGHAEALEQKHAIAAPTVPTWRERLMAVVSGALRPVPALAFALLLCLGGLNVYQMAVLNKQKNLIAELKAPKQEFRFVLTGIAHGAGDAKLVQAPRDAVVSLGVEYNRSGEYVAYRAQIVSKEGSVMRNVEVPTTAGNMAMIALMPSSLDDGDYNLVILGRTADGNEQEVGRGSFRLRSSDK